jgi:L-seryl-tRNA(Ser) seleniumtransferase
LGTLRGLVAEARATARQATIQRLPEVAAVGRRLVEQLLGEPGAECRQVINATGVLVPFELAPRLPAAALERIRQRLSVDGFAASPPVADPSREEAALRLLATRAGAEAALALHNPAGALAATFAALGGERAIIVARRDLARVCRRSGLGVTDAAALAGAQLAPVGHVDHLTLDDYAAVVAQRPAAIFCVRGGEFEIGGRQPALADLAALAARAEIPLVALLPTAPLLDPPRSLPSENDPSRPRTDAAVFDLGVPTVGGALAAGVDVVVCDGHRALGGPACGVVIGRREILSQVAATPLGQVLAADALTLAAIEGILRVARDHESAVGAVPLWQMLSAPQGALRSRAQRLAPQIAACSRVKRTEIASGVAYLGPGKLARDRLDDWRILVEPAGCSPAELADALDAGSPAVWATIDESLDGGRLVLSLRSAPAGDDERLALAFTQLGTKPGPPALG